MDAMKAEPPRPDLSIVLVSDYAAGTGKSWNDLKSSLLSVRRELATVSHSIQCLLVEEQRFAASVPSDVLVIVPGLTVLPVEATTSYAMKNAGVAAAAADWVVLLDADCRMLEGWLPAALRAIKTAPDAAAISGRTFYAGRSLFERISALVQRSYLDPGARSASRFISNNNAVWRRDWFLRFPMPEDLGPFSSRVQSERMLRAGATLLFEPDMRVIHDFEGVAMDADIARNIGYGTVITRLADPDMPHARLVRLGRGAIPAIVLGKTCLHVRDVVRCARAYDVRWWQIPLAWGYAAFSTLMEAPGMWAAYSGQHLVNTAYR
jgi:hypothetical protein